ncbi:MAG: methionyl-tRNA formyltransferase [Candidatus Binatia bacterium]
MGTPAFACPSLTALLGRPDPVVGVVCQPDRPRGRGLALAAPEVKELALRNQLPVLQPPRIRDPTFLETLQRFAPDLVVVAAYGRILPRTVLDLPPRGCINVHASILPRYRGAAPIQHAILAGDAETGVTIMAMSEEMDAGDVLLVRTTSISPQDTGGTLAERLARLGAEALGAAIDGLKAGTLRRSPQPATGITFAPRIERDHTRLDWARSAVELERMVRAFAPEPSAFTSLGGAALKVHRAAVVDEASAAPPGTVVTASPRGLVVATGDRGLVLLEVQLQGRRRMPIAAFLAGNPIAPGTWLGT